jgi:hypothetical protein
MPISYDVETSCQCDTCKAKNEICKKPEPEKCEKCSCCKKQRKYRKHKKHSRCSDNDSNSDSECNAICVKPTKENTQQSDCKQSDCKSGNYVVITINSFTPVTETTKCCK